MKKPIPFGKYYLLERVNVGGMAEVFRAKAFGVEGFERVVAVKRILPSIAEDTDFITMFIDEAKIAVQLTHANIAQIFDLGKVGESYFIALEYVHGKDARAIFDRTRKRGQSVPLEMACYIIMKVCEGLDYAHNKRDANGRPLDLVHRDVSPQNLLISFDGEVKIIDFGIAKAAGKAGKTQAGILKGKFGYLSPEQVRGEPIDRRSDIFGVGICLYELLTGERLFAGDSDFSALEKVRNVEVPAPSSLNEEIPDALERILMKALSSKVMDRYQTAMDLHDELQSFLYSNGQSFARKDLSAWMRETFGAEAEPPGEPSVKLSPPSEAGADVNHLDTAESRPVISPDHNESEAANVSSQAKAKAKSTILGMPAMVPPADLGSSRGRSVPPPPPRSSAPPPTSALASSTRSVPPPPPSVSTSNSPAPLPPLALSPTPAGAKGPNSASRSVPPPPPRKSSVPPPPSVSSSSAKLPAPPSAASLEPPAAPGSPVLDMDWDDEELSTQIYDRPEDGFEYDPDGADYHEPAPVSAELTPSRGSARHVATYVPGASNGLPAVEMPEPDPMVEVPASPHGAMGSTQTMPVMDNGRSGNRGLMAAIALLAVIALGFGAYALMGKTPGVVRITTDPPDATVLFDANQAGGSSSPFIVTNVEPDTEHLLEVRKDGFKPWSQSLQVRAGDNLEIPVKLLPEQPAEPASPAVAGTPAEASATGFSVDTRPVGASVLLDGKDNGGATPLKITAVEPGVHNIEIRKEGYRSHESQVQVRPGQVIAMPLITLEPLRVDLAIESEPAGATVTLMRGGEQRVVGRTPVTTGVDNEGGAWTVKLEKDGYGAYESTLPLPQKNKQFVVKADLEREQRAASTPRRAPRRPTRVAREPKPKPEGTPAPAATGGGTGTLRVQTRPWSQVYVDGKLIGNTPQMNISLPSGRHRLTLVNPDFNLRKTVNVNIRAGQVETKIINLN